jgi:hypothetical protein
VTKIVSSYGYVGVAGLRTVTKVVAHIDDEPTVIEKRENQMLVYTSVGGYAIENTIKQLNLCKSL